MIHYKTVLADFLTPVSAYLRVAGVSDRAFLLESVEGGERIARYSFIGVDPGRSFRGSYADFRTSFPPAEAPHPELPPFAGGAVGCFAYDLVRELERLPDHHPERQGIPAVQMDFYTTVLAFDHVKHQIVIMSHDGPEKVEEMETRLGQISPQETVHHYPETLGLERPGNLRASQLGSGGVADETSWTHVRSRFSGQDYCGAVERAREYIKAGDIFQVVLARDFEVPYAGDPFSVYRALRFINPSPYMFFLKQKEQCIAGASPEMLIRVQDRDLEYRPIAGTRRRGRSPGEDERLEAELLADEKERAEHLMLVDLGRNDLGRVSEFGGVSVEDFMFVERYSHVMHLVSAIRGRLAEGLDRFDAMAACFPAGTVTGAPKIRAMEIIEELEPTSRGIYAGAIGYLDYSGNLDTCIAIRTITLSGGRAKFQAGAGIVADSIADREELECRNKARALVHALELAGLL